LLSISIHRKLLRDWITISFICACVHFSLKLVERCVKWTIVTLPFMLMLLESFYNIYHQHQRNGKWMWIGVVLRLTFWNQLHKSNNDWMLQKKLWNTNQFGKRMKKVNTLSSWLQKLRWKWITMLGLWSHYWRKTPWLSPHDVWNKILKSWRGNKLQTKQVVQLASQGWNKHRFQLSMECKELVIEILKAITNTINWRNPMWIRLCSES